MLKNKLTAKVVFALIILVTLVTVTGIYFYWRVLKHRQPPTQLNQAGQMITPHPTNLPRRQPLVKSKGIKAEGESAIYRINQRVKSAVYRPIIAAAWQELVDKGYAQRDKNRSYLVTIRYPRRLGSTEAVKAVVDLRKPIEMSLSDQPQMFGNKNLSVSLQVKNRQLYLKLYQLGSYDDPKAVGGLSLAFDVMAIGMEPHYRGRRPVITAFTQLLQPKSVKLLERK